MSACLYSVLFNHFILSTLGIRGLANQPKTKNLSILPLPPLFVF